MKCVFCDIKEHTEAAHCVFEDTQFLIILDIKPVFLGHCLIMPKTHVESLDTLPPEQTGPLFTLVKNTAKSIELALGAQGTFIAINNKVSQSVPHLHVHAVPRTPKDGLKGFFWPRQRYDSEEAAQITAQKIREALQSLS